MRILGIDPGLSGGVAILITGGDLDGPCRCWGAIDIPTMGEDVKRRVDAKEFERFIRAGIPDHAVIERAGIMPSQGASSGFRYGRAVGALEAVVHCCNVPLAIVEPQAWKKHFGLPGKLKATDAKEQARLAALRVLPSAAEFFKLKKDHGKAEALLIAMWLADTMREPIPLSRRSNDIVRAAS